MRRKDREVTELSEIIGMINRCEVLHLGLVDDGRPYIVPLNFGFEEKDGQLTFVFHSAKEGRKIDVIKRNPNACFELSRLHKIIRGEKPAGWTARYESVIGYGELRPLESAAEKTAAMDMIMRKYGYEGVPEYAPQAIDETAVYKLSVSEITGKRNMKPEDLPPVEA